MTNLNGQIHGNALFLSCTRVLLNKTEVKKLFRMVLGYYVFACVSIADEIQKKSVK